MVADKRKPTWEPLRTPLTRRLERVVRGDCDLARAFAFVEPNGTIVLLVFDDLFRGMEADQRNALLEGLIIDPIDWDRVIPKLDWENVVTFTATASRSLRREADFAEIRAFRLRARAALAECSTAAEGPPWEHLRTPETRALEDAVRRAVLGAPTAASGDRVDAYAVPETGHIRLRVVSDVFIRDPPGRRDRYVRELLERACPALAARVHRLHCMTRAEARKPSGVLAVADEVFVRMSGVEPPALPGVPVDPREAALAQVAALAHDQIEAGTLTAEPTRRLVAAHATLVTIRRLAREALAAPARTKEETPCAS